MTGTTNIEWVSHPLKEEPILKSLALILTILFVCIIIHLTFENALYAFTALVLLTVSMSRYFLPTQYTLGPSSFTISHAGINRTYLWTDFHRAILHPDGIFLSPFVKPHRLDSFRGQFLKSSHPKEIYHVIEQHIETDPT